MEEDSPVAEGQNGKAVTPWSEPRHSKHRAITLVAGCFSLMLAACGEVTAPAAEATSASIPFADSRPDAAEITGWSGVFSGRNPETVRDSANSPNGPSRVSAVHHRDSNYDIAY